MLRRRVIGYTHIVHSPVAAADGYHQPVRKDLFDKRGNRLILGCSEGTDESVSVSVPLVAVKRDCDVSTIVVHDKDERPIVRAQMALTNCHR